MIDGEASGGRERYGPNEAPIAFRNLELITTPFFALPCGVFEVEAQLGFAGGRCFFFVGSARVHVGYGAAGGNSNREIARLLFIGERTVETHIAAISDRFDLRSRAELATER